MEWVAFVGIFVVLELSVIVMQMMEHKCLETFDVAKADCGEEFLHTGFLFFVRLTFLLFAKRGHRMFGFLAMKVQILDLQDLQFAALWSTLFESEF